MTSASRGLHRARTLGTHKDLTATQGPFQHVTINESWMLSVSTPRPPSEERMAHWSAFAGALVSSPSECPETQIPHTKDKKRVSTREAITALKHF